jgi:hypothetical protein
MSGGGARVERKVRVTFYMREGREAAWVVSPDLWRSMRQNLATAKGGFLTVSDPDALEEHAVAVAYITGWDAVPVDVPVEAAS